MLAFLVFAATFSAPATPLAGLHGLVGRWTCTYRAGATRIPYGASWAYDRDGHTLRETTSFAGGGGDEELLGHDDKGGKWTAVVFEDTGATTILSGTGSNPKRIAFRSVYPDASIAETVDLVSTTEYTIHADVRAGGKRTMSVDTCVRDAR